MIAMSETARASAVEGGRGRGRRIDHQPDERECREPCRQGVKAASPAGFAGADDRNSENSSLSASDFAMSFHRRTGPPL
jgi:hypothetical protein